MTMTEWAPPGHRPRWFRVRKDATEAEKLVAYEAELQRFIAERGSDDERAAQ